ncbi:hypothetical protein V1515DRAFT_568461 [Lipomyces mesembrius]
MLKYIPPQTFAGTLTFHWRGGQKKTAARRYVTSDDCCTFQFSNRYTQALLLNFRKSVKMVPPGPTPIARIPRFRAPAPVAIYHPPTSQPSQVDSAGEQTPQLAEQSAPSTPFSDTISDGVDGARVLSATPSPPPGRYMQRGRRERSLSPEDSEQRVIDAEKVTMADLCRDIHIGRKSTVYDKLQKYRQAEKERKRNAIPESEDERQLRLKLEEDEERERKENAAKMLERGIGETAVDGPKLRVVGGRIIVDEESLQVDRHERDARTEARPEDIETADEYKRRVNSASWSRRERVERWNVAETMKFYDALSMWGTDFGLITQMFRGRSRRQIKNKFNSEERKNPTRIHMALNRRLPVDEQYLKNEKSQ